MVHAKHRAEENETYRMVASFGLQEKEKTSVQH